MITQWFFIIFFVDSHTCDYDKGSVTDDVKTSTSWKENGRQKDKKDKRKKGKESNRIYWVHIDKGVNFIRIKGRRQ